MVATTGLPFWRFVSLMVSGQFEAIFHVSIGQFTTFTTDDFRHHRIQSLRMPHIWANISRKSQDWLRSILSPTGL
jgi:hypothetical protein